MSSISPIASCLHFHSIYTPSSESSHADSFVIRTLFGGEAPAPKVLSFSLKPMVLYVDRFSALAHLRIVGHQGCHPTDGDLLNLLCNTPALETFIDVEPRPVVYLDRFRAGFIDACDPNTTFALLHHMRVPPTATLHFHHIGITNATIGAGDALEIIVPDIDRLHVRMCRWEGGGGLWFSFHHVTFDGDELTPVLARARACARDLRVHAADAERCRAGLVGRVMDALGARATTTTPADARARDLGLGRGRFRAYHLGQAYSSRTLYTGRGFSFDCELIALSLAIGNAYLKRYHHVHIFCDNETALTSITDTSGGRMAAVNTCRILRDWFERHPENHLHLHWCSSHSGIDENDAIDADVKHTARAEERDIPDYLSDGLGFLTSYAYRGRAQRSGR
ncbi:hypothetical protein BC628DRAFT_1423122 [Trametes gibbosa]|nr:hypothetical protein BC628DRAFT_1423122 [Trametes gibbosa]